MTDIIVNFFNFLSSLAGRFPDLSVDNTVLSRMSSGMDAVFDFLGQVNFFIPLDHILVIIGLVYSIRAAKLVLFVVNWIIRRIADVIP